MGIQISPPRPFLYPPFLYPYVIIREIQSITPLFYTLNDTLFVYSYTFSYTFDGVSFIYHQLLFWLLPLSISPTHNENNKYLQPQEQISMVEPHTTTFAEPIMKEVCTKIDGCRVILIMFGLIV